MEAGTRVWCSADGKGDEAWILAEVVKKGETEIELQQVDKKENVFTRELDARDEDTGATKFKGVELANTPLSEAERAAGADNDLITLPHLHEPAILHAVSERFYHGSIYTWTGPVIIAVNPFQRLPLYTEVCKSYVLFVNNFTNINLTFRVSFCFSSKKSMLHVIGNSRTLQKRRIISIARYGK